MEVASRSPQGELMNRLVSSLLHRLASWKAKLRQRVVSRFILLISLSCSRLYALELLTEEPFTKSLVNALPCCDKRQNHNEFRP